MSRPIRSIAALAAMLSPFVIANAEAQTAKDLVGTWTLVSSIIEKDGTKTDTFGPNPSGQLILGSDGHFVLVFTRRDLPKVASGSRTSSSPEEAQAIAHGSVASFGTYTVENKTLVMHIEGATFPNWNGAEQRRPFSLSGDELTYTSPGTTGVPTQVTVRRVK